MQCTSLNVVRGVDDVEVSIQVIDALGDPYFMDVTGRKEAYLYIDGKFDCNIFVNSIEPDVPSFTIQGSYVVFTFPKSWQRVGTVSVSLSLNFIATVGDSTRDIEEYNSNLFELINFYE